MAEKFVCTAYDGVFDASLYEPVSGGSRTIVPEGWYYATVTSTSRKVTKAGDGGYLELGVALVGVEGATANVTGELPQRLNLWSSNEQAQQIAHGQLSAICHIVGLRTLNLANEARDLIGKRYRLFVKVKESQSTRVGASTSDTFKSNEAGAIADLDGNPPSRATPQQQATAAPQGWSAPASQQNQPNQGPSGAAADWSNGQLGMPANLPAQGGNWSSQTAPAKQPSPAPAGEGVPWAR